MAKAIKAKKAKTEKPVHVKKGFSVLKKGLTAKDFIAQLKAHQSDTELKKIQRYFKSGEGDYGHGDKFMGLLESPVHEVRAGAVSIMDKASRNKKISKERLKDFFDLYMRRHDRINNWDLCDLGCLCMTGSYLYDKPHDILYKLARSKNIWERRTAILSTCYFIRQGDVTDTFKIAEILVNDNEDLIHKATGWMLRFAGTKDQKKLIAFLNKHAATMPRTLLRYSIEHFSSKERANYLKMKTA